MFIDVFTQVLSNVPPAGDNRSTRGVIEILMELGEAIEGRDFGVAGAYEFPSLLDNDVIQIGLIH